MSDENTNYRLSAINRLAENAYRETLPRANDSRSASCSADRGILETILRAMTHAKTFIGSRQKMHDHGIDIYDAAIADLEEILEQNSQDQEP